MALAYNASQPAVFCLQIFLYNISPAIEKNNYIHTPFTYQQYQHSAKKEKKNLNKKLSIRIIRICIL